MNLSEPKLAICIPTLNRLPHLQQMLPVLLKEAESHDVIVCVSDNHSEDGTRDYLAGLSGAHRCLRYKVQGHRLPIDESMLAAIEMATTEYVYPLGDDDFLPENTLALILDELRHSPDLLVLNSTHTNPALEPINSHVAQSFWGAAFVSATDAFVVFGGVLPGLLPFGSFLAKKDLYRLEAYGKYIGTSHAYIGSIWEELLRKKECSIRCMKNPTVYLRGDTKTWDDKKSRVMLLEIPLWFKSLPVAYQKTGKSFYKKYLKKNFKLSKLLKYKLANQLDVELYREIADLRVSCRIYKLLFVVAISSGMAKFILKLKGLFNS